MEENTNTATGATTSENTKFCSECGQKIAAKAVICPHCGCQVAKPESAPNITINNSNQNQNNQAANAALARHMKNKWVAVLLCIFLGAIGGHKFYEGKIGMGILYLFTGGLLGIGVIVDLITLLFKPNPYFV